MYALNVPAAPNTHVCPRRYSYRQPFYRTTWFMVTLAAASVVILIAIVAVLCVKSKSYKYKSEYAGWLGADRWLV